MKLYENIKEHYANDIIKRIEAKGIVKNKPNIKELEDTIKQELFGVVKEIVVEKTSTSDVNVDDVIKKVIAENLDNIIDEVLKELKLKCKKKETVKVDKAASKTLEDNGNIETTGKEEKAVDKEKTETKKVEKVEKVEETKVTGEKTATTGNSLVPNLEKTEELKIGIDEINKLSITGDEATETVKANKEEKVETKVETKIDNGDKEKPVFTL